MSGFDRRVKAIVTAVAVILLGAATAQLRATVVNLPVIVVGTVTQDGDVSNGGTKSFSGQTMTCLGAAVATSRKQIFIRFDTSSIPASATVNAVSLNLDLTAFSGN